MSKKILNISNSNDSVSLLMKNKNKIPFIIGGILIVVISAIVGFIVLPSNPDKEMRQAIEATEADLQKARVYFAPVDVTGLETLTKQNKIDFLLKLKNVSFKQGAPILMPKNLELSGNMNVDEDAKKLDAQFAVNWENTNIINPEINLDGNFISVFVPELYDKYVSIDLNNINEDLKNSAYTELSSITVSDTLDSSTEGAFSLSTYVNDSLKDISQKDDSAIKTGSFFSLISKGSDESEMAKKGETEKVDEYNCKTYTAEYSENTTKTLLKEIANQLPERGGEVETALAMIPDTAYCEAIERIMLFKEAFDSAESITKPVSAKYYVDNKKKVRRADYEARFDYKGESYSIEADISYLGNTNVYDTVAMNVLIYDSKGKINIKADLNSANDDGGKLNNNFKYDIIFTDDVNNSYTITLLNNKSRGEADNTSEGEITLTGDWSPHSYVVGYKGVIDGYKAKFDDFYVESPYADISFALEFGISKSETATKSKEEIPYVEILKSSPEEIIEIETEIKSNVTKLATKVLGSIGS